MYDGDPCSHFLDTSRPVSEDYKRLALHHLKLCFRNVRSAVIVKAFNAQQGRFYPAYKALEKEKAIKKNLRKSKRLDSECALAGADKPGQQQPIDLTFLKELQFTRSEKALFKYKEQEESNRKEQVTKILYFCLFQRLLPSL